MPGLMSAFQEDNGNTSSMRLIVAFAFVVVLSTWAFVCIKTGQLVPIPAEQVGLLLGSLGAKAWQKGREADVSQAQ